MVVGKDGKLVPMMNIWRGEKPDGIMVLVGDGFKLLATADHPISVQEGMKRAGKLKEGELVITEFGPRSIHISHKSGLVEVFNLHTENREPF